MKWYEGSRPFLTILKEKEKNMLNGRYITPREASQQLGISEHGVRARLRRGQLTAIKQGQSWFIRADTTTGLVLPTERRELVPNTWRV